MTHFTFVLVPVAGVAILLAIAGMRRRCRNLRVWPGCLAALAGGFFIAGTALAQPENTGTTRQPLVAGTVVDSATQQQFGLLTLFAPAGSCSASMLNDYWAITAAHCLKAADGVTTVLPNQVSLSANWPGNSKVAKAVRIVDFNTPAFTGNKRLDIALVMTGRYDFPRGVPEMKLHPQRIGSNESITAYGRGISALASGSGPTATPVQRDGQYRSASFVATGVTATSYSYGPSGAAITAGGDSGGPSYIQTWDHPDSPQRRLEWRLVGIHSSAQTICLAGKMCVPPSPWTWVASVSRGTDAAVQPVVDDIAAAIRDMPPDNNFVGRFDFTPVPVPVWRYSLTPAGDLLWHANRGGIAWDGPRKVGTGWDGFRDVIGAGGNRFYARTVSGDLLWYQHNGFNGGTFDWKGAVKVGWGWGDFARIFGGGDGVVYAITQDGDLHWYRHAGFKYGGDVSTWLAPRLVGTGWGGAREVFSAGEGVIYLIRPNGDLLWYRHKDVKNGTAVWDGPVKVGNGWQNFLQVFSPGDGRILALQPNGDLLLYRHRSWNAKLADASWDAPVRIGTGWQGYRSVFSFAPESFEPPH